jgi:hypothetical protein
LHCEGQVIDGDEVAVTDAEVVEFDSRGRHGVA